MRLAFVLFHYFPYGGLERDMLAMAELCQQRGHDVVIYTGHWQGEQPAHMAIKELPVKKAYSNPGRNAAFIAALKPILQQEQRVVIGFNKMPGLDFYYAADTCFATKARGERGWLYRATARSRQYLAHEKAVFGVQSHTECLMISRQEMVQFQHYYNTPDKRLHLLPPGIRKDRVMPADYAQQRLALRQQYKLAEDDKLIVMVGSDFQRKGLDRAIEGLAALPAELAKTQLWVAGQDKAAAFNKLAHKRGVADRVSILGPRDDVSQLMWAADAFIHAAYSENTGTVILEAMVAGLPAVVSDVCGYAHWVADWQLGAVLSSPITAADTAAALQQVLTRPRAHWVELARDFAKQDIYSMTEHAVALIEQKGKHL